MLSTQAPSCINLLPVEILAEIFRLVCFTLYPYWGPPIALTAPSLHCAVKLSAVSRRWRYIALSMPILWCDISVGMNDSGKRKNIEIEGTIERVRRQLERSPTSSLRLRLALYVLRKQNDLERVWRLFMPHLGRCSSFTAYDVDDDAARIMFPLPAMNRLTDLTLRSSYLPISLTSVFASHRPSLTIDSMEIGEFSLEENPVHEVHQLSVSVGQSYSVSVGLSDVIRWLRCWPGADHLQSLDLGDCNFKFDKVDSPLTPVTLPELSTLRIETSPLHSYIHAPNLRTLVCGAFDGWRGMSGVMDFPTVEHLHAGFDTESKWNLKLCHWDDDSDAVPDMHFMPLIDFTSLKTLTLHGFPRLNSWLEHLRMLKRRSPDDSPDSSRDAFVPLHAPNLELLRINLSNGWFREDTFRMLAWLLSGRAGLCVQLKEDQIAQMMEVCWAPESITTEDEREVLNDRVHEYTHHPVPFEQCQKRV